MLSPPSSSPVRLSVVAAQIRGAQGLLPCFPATALIPWCPPSLARVPVSPVPAVSGIMKALRLPACAPSVAYCFASKVRAILRSSCLPWRLDLRKERRRSEACFIGFPICEASLPRTLDASAGHCRMAEPLWVSARSTLWESAEPVEVVPHALRVDDESSGAVAPVQPTPSAEDRFLALSARSLGLILKGSKGSIWSVRQAVEQFPLFAHSRRPLRPCSSDCPFYDIPLRSRVRLQRRTQPSGEDGHVDLPSRGDQRSSEPHGERTANSKLTASAANAAMLPPEGLGRLLSGGSALSSRKRHPQIEVHE